MRLLTRLRAIADGLPVGAAVTLPVQELREWLDDASPGFEPDYTVAEVAKLVGRSPVTVRAWIREGTLDGYLFRGREYRVPRESLERLGGRSPPS